MNENKLWVDHLGGLLEHVLAAVESLDDDALTRPVLPSGWTCLDLVHHLAEDAETFWIQGVVAGDPQGGLDRLDPDSWTVPDDVTPRQVLERYSRLPPPAPTPSCWQPTSTPVSRGGRTSSVSGVRARCARC